MKLCQNYILIHQKEIQNRPEVNAKRSATLKHGMTEERRKQISITSARVWAQKRSKSNHKQLFNINEEHLDENKKVKTNRFIRNN